MVNKGQGQTQSPDFPGNLPFSGPSPAPTPPEERVPRSLHEIYHLSKQNRKRNKDKKRLKEDNVPDPSPAFAPTNTTQEDGDEVCVGLEMACACPCACGCVSVCLCLCVCNVCSVWIIRGF